MALCKVLFCPSRYNAEYYLLLYRDWEYPHLHTVVKGATSVLTQVSVRLTPTCPSFTTLCFPTVQDSLCQVSHWGSISWLVI